MGDIAVEGLEVMDSTDDGMLKVQCRLVKEVDGGTRRKYMHTHAQTHVHMH